MRTVCPACGSTGNVPDDKLPPGGANIRCPSCSHIFFVGGEVLGRESASVEAVPPAASSGGTAAGATPEEASRISPAGETREETTGEAAVPDDWLRSLGTPADAGDADRDLHDTELVETVDWSADVDSGTYDPPAAEPPQGAADDDDASDAGGLRFAGHRGPWKVKDAIGMVYDFPDTDSLRMWLTSRSSFDEIFVSPDGDDWAPVPEVAPLRGVQATGFSAARRAVPRAPKAEVVPPARAGSRTRSFSGAHESAAAAADRSETRAAAASGSGLRSVAKSGEVPRASASERRPRPAAGDASLSRSGSGPSARSRQETGRVPTAADRRTERRTEKSEERSATQRVVRTAALLLVLVGLAGYAATSMLGGEVASSYPNTPAGQQVEWMVQALNDSARLANGAAIQQRFAPAALEAASVDELRDWFTYFDQLVPTYEFVKVSSERSDYAITIELETSLAHRLELSIETDSAAPHGILNMNLREL